MEAPELVEPAGFERLVFPAMGTTVTVLLPFDSAGRAADVRRLFAEWEAALSRFRPDSELSGLNAAAGREARVSPLLFDVVVASLEAARATGGLFDPTLGARLAELGYDRTFKSLPADRPSAGLRPWTPGAWRDVRADHRLRTVSLPEGAAIDVGGIAKGMAVDASIDLLASRGVASAAVDAGGDLAVLGLPGDRPAWTIEIETPDDGTDRPVVAVSTGALATSSVGRRRWLVDGRVRHHLVDPRDGLPARTDAWSASVLATSCRVAEVAAKAALLLGLEEGAAFLRHHGLSGMFVTPGGEAVEVRPVERPEQTVAPGRTATDAAAADGAAAHVVVPS